MQKKTSSEKIIQENINEQRASIIQLGANIPGVLKVIKRNKEIVLFDENKIRIAMSKAFLAIESNAVSSERIHDTVEKLTKEVANYFQQNIDREQTIDIEKIQDRVELELMRNEFHGVARSYVLYREKRKTIRENSDIKTIKKINVKMPNGAIQPLNINLLYAVVKAACHDLDNVDPKYITESSVTNLFDGVSLDDVNRAVIMTSRTLIEQEPNYSYATARLLLNCLKQEAKSFLKINSDDINIYPQYFPKYIRKGIELNILAPYMGNFDLDVLAKAIENDRDQKFTYLSIQTLYDRYLLHSNEIRYELPQAFFMRVAMGLAYKEEQPEEKAIEFYHILSSFLFMSSTPTLFNSGTLRPQLSSCFLTTIPDDLKGIYDSVRDNALLSKYAGGIGNDWTPVRAMGAHIKGTNGKSLGVVPFMNVADATAIAVNQGGKRKGAVCAYLETWHLDIEEFLDLRKNTGDERRRTHDMNTANWVPDLFMKRVTNKQSWTLFSPEDVPELHDLYGNKFDEAYEKYEHDADNGKIKNFKKIPAVSLWRKILSSIFETGHPWVTFKDPCNLRSPQQHVGVVHSSNLCTEITLNTNDKEVAVCNLGSINLPMHIENKQLNRTKLEKTINTAIRMLDNVIDRNYYTIPQAKSSNMKHRPIGLGIMGFQDCLYELEINYESDEAVKFADLSMEVISYYALKASHNLAKERGAYETFPGSLWSKGILPIDSINILKNYRGRYCQQDTSMTLVQEWEQLREDIKQHGIRNSNVLAIAPTATISNICGISQSIEPTYQNLFVKSNMSGEFTIVNPYLVKELKSLQIWDNVMVNDIKYYDGSIAKISRIPEHIRFRFKTAFEIDAIWLIKNASRRSKWIDQAQSLNLYVKEASGKIIDNLYITAWLLGLKTTYYCRTLAATSTEKATINERTLNSVNISSQSCSIDDEDCEACQ